eukprot:scaffold1220_cov259-Pinguiococcus_pyrenoidosus.AAC.139
MSHCERSGRKSLPRPFRTVLAKRKAAQGNAAQKRTCDDSLRPIVGVGKICGVQDVRLKTPPRAHQQAHRRLRRSLRTATLFHTREVVLEGPQSARSVSKPRANTSVS